MCTRPPLRDGIRRWTRPSQQLMHMHCCPSIPAMPWISRASRWTCHADNLSAEQCLLPMHLSVSTTASPVRHTLGKEIGTSAATGTVQRWPAVTSRFKLPALGRRALASLSSRVVGGFPANAAEH